jgi:hypothetical protein
MYEITAKDNYGVDYVVVRFRWAGDARAWLARFRKEFQGVMVYRVR